MAATNPGDGSRAHRPYLESRRTTFVSRPSSQGLKPVSRLRGTAPVFDRNRKNDAKLFSVGHEYMVVYVRNKGLLTEMDIRLRAPKEGVEEIREEFERLRSEE